MKALLRAAALTGAGFVAFAPPAHADFIVTPFAGKTFAAQTTLLPLSNTVDKQTWILGTSATWLTDNVLGAELDFGYAPRFFANPLVLRSGSNVISLTGNVILTVPLAVTRDSLRPYVSGGMGLLHAGVGDRADVISTVADVESNFLAMSIGGGAIGFLNSRAGIRFDLRHLRSTSRAPDFATGETEPRLGFWRATIGVAIRY